MEEKKIARELLVVAKSVLSGGWGRFSEDLSDIIEGQIMVNKGKGASGIFHSIKEQLKTDKGLEDMMREEGMSDRDLKKMIAETLKFMP